MYASWLICQWLACKRPKGLDEQKGSAKIKSEMAARVLNRAYTLSVETVRTRTESEEQVILRFHTYNYYIYIYIYVCVCVCVCVRVRERERHFDSLLLQTKSITMW